MKIQYLLLYIWALGMLCCQPNNKGNASTELKEGNEDRLHLDIKENVVRATLIDSLKWVLYTFNYESRAFSEESKDSISPLACTLKLVEINRPGKDTTLYYFDAFYKNRTERYVFYPTDYIGVGIINDHISHLVSSHTMSGLIPNQLFLSHEASFCKYLKEYKGEIDEWLKKEADKRKVWE